MGRPNHLLASEKYKVKFLHSKVTAELQYNKTECPGTPDTWNFYQGFTCSYLVKVLVEGMILLVLLQCTSKLGALWDPNFGGSARALVCSFLLVTTFINGNIGKVHIYLIVMVSYVIY